MKKIFLFLVIMLLFLTGCNSKKYEVKLENDYVFKSKKTHYKEGEKVKVYFDFIATDTDYTFYVDGNYINPDYDDKNNRFIIEFKMPDHDVEITYDSKNTMVAPDYIEYNE